MENEEKPAGKRRVPEYYDYILWQILAIIIFSKQI
jgi:hypothetical protein